jgi:hypothetical protein
MRTTSSLMHPVLRSGTTELHGILSVLSYSQPAVRRQTRPRKQRCETNSTDAVYFLVQRCTFQTHALVPVFEVVYNCLIETETSLYRVMLSLGNPNIPQ